MLKKNNLIKLGELSLAGAALASLSVNSNVQKSVKASGNVPKVSSDTDTQTLNTNALTRMMNKNTERNVAQLAANKVSAVANTSNGGFDSSWGKLDVKDWKGHVDGNYYVLDQYTGDPYHVIVPNAADFKAAGIDTQGKQVGVSSDFMHGIYMKLYQNKDKDGSSIAFSKTDGAKVKATNSLWMDVFNPNIVGEVNTHYALSKFDGSNFDVSNITVFDSMFANNSLSDISSLVDWDTNKATSMQQLFIGNNLTNLNGLQNWDVSNVTLMGGMFDYNHNLSSINGLENWNVSNITDMSDLFNEDNVSDLTPLKKWNVNKVTNMTGMFYGNNINDLSPIKDWPIDNVTYMSAMFMDNKISNLSPIANWNMSNKVSTRSMLGGNQITDVTPLANWNMSSNKDMGLMFYKDKIADLTPLANWNTSKVTDMSDMFSENYALRKADFSKWNFGSIKITNPLSGSTGLGGFIDTVNQRALINLGNNNTLPDWFMKSDVNGKLNKNVFTSPYGGNIILTSNPKLLANPNKAFNSVEFQFGYSNDKYYKSPVFINSTFDKILDISNKTHQDAVNKFKQDYPSYKMDGPKYAHYKFVNGGTVDSSTGVPYEADNPVDVVNADYKVQQAYSMTVKFNDKTAGNIIDSNNIVINEPETASIEPAISYVPVQNIIKKLQESGYDVSNFNVHKPESIVKNWDDVIKLQNTTNNAYNVTNDKGQATLTYNVSHKMVKVTHDAPKTTSDIITGTTKKFPAGVGQDDLNKTITRTITLKDENGNPMGKDIVQTIHMHRDATVDAVTGAITYTPWVADGSFDGVDVPKIDGYTPDKTKISKVDNPELGKDYNESVVYHKNDEDAAITYIDDTTGKVLKTDSIKPKFGDGIKFETAPSDYIKELESKGYVLVSNDFKDGTTASSDVTKNKFTVHVRHDQVKVERTKEVHEKITNKITNANGKVTTEQSKNVPTLIFKQTGVKDSVTGNVDWNGKIDSQTFKAVKPDEKVGYVATPQMIPEKAVTITNADWDKDHDVNVTVNYAPAEESVKLVIKDENGNVIKTIVKTGKYGADYDFSNEKPEIDGYTFVKVSDNVKGKFDVNNKDIVLTYKKNEQKKPDTPVIPSKPQTPQRTPEDTSIFGKNIGAQKDDQGLPEMAENKSGLIAAGVGLASLAGLTGLAGTQIKKLKEQD